MKSPAERAAAYLDKLDPAISGNAGHNQTFAACCKLVEFGLTEEEAWPIAWAYNARCQPPWTEKQLRHKLRDAYRRAEPGKKLRDGHAHASGASPAYRPAPAYHPAPPPAAALPAVKPGNYDVRPADLPDAIPDGARILIRTLFRAHEGVRIAQGTIEEGDSKERPDGSGLVLTAEQWLKRLDDADGKPTNIWSSSKGAGVFVTVNPMRVGGSSDADVTDFRHALLEWDTLSIEEQWGLINASRVPCAAVIYSAGKSVHAWVKIDAKNRAEYDERVRILHEHFSQYGQDTQNKNPSRFSRLPGAARKGRMQELIATGLGCASWAEWHAGLQAEGIGTVITTDDLEAFDTSNDPNSLIGKRWLCKGGSCVIVGPSGVGKSSLTMQVVMGWALGRPVFGMTPARPLKFIVIQAENDAGDLAEEYQGVLEGMGLDAWSSPDPEVKNLLRSNVVFVRNSTHTGERFAQAARILVEKHRPDVVVFDPLLSFVGGDISKQEVCSQFLRGWLNPISEASGVAWIAIHHTGKPPGDKQSRQGWQSSDWSYAGIGSSELTNWTRAAMVLRQTSPGAFQLMLTKRGSRAGATHPDGQPTSVVWLKWATDRIHWEHVQPPEEMPEEDHGGARQERRGKGSGGAHGKRGRPSRVDHALAVYPIEEWVASIPPEGWGRNEAAKSLENWLATKGEDIPLPTIKDADTGMLGKLLKAGKLTKKDGKYLRL